MSHDEIEPATAQPTGPGTEEPASEVALAGAATEGLQEAEGPQAAEAAEGDPQEKPPMTIRQRAIGVGPGGQQITGEVIITLDYAAGALRRRFQEDVAPQAAAEGDVDAVEPEEPAMASGYGAVAYALSTPEATEGDGGLAEESVPLEAAQLEPLQPHADYIQGERSGIEECLQHLMSEARSLARAQPLEESIQGLRIAATALRDRQVKFPHSTPDGVIEAVEALADELRAHRQLVKLYRCVACLVGLGSADQDDVDELLKCLAPIDPGLHEYMKLLPVK